VQNVSVPLIGQFFIGFLDVNQIVQWCMFINLVLTYRAGIQYIHCESSDTAAAAGNIARCALAAGGVAVMQPLLESTGEGPYFTLVAGLTIVPGLVAISITRNKRMGWLLRREVRRTAKTEVGHEREEMINEENAVWESTAVGREYTQIHIILRMCILIVLLMFKQRIRWE
jgi:hypothetical protein